MNDPRLSFRLRRSAVLAVLLVLSARLVAADAAPAPKVPAAPTAPVKSAAPAAGSASVQGKWTAEFETQVGVQTYTYEFTVEGEKLTGTAEGSMFGGKVEITDGKVAGSKVTFTEKQDFGGMDIAIAYTGELKGDEIAFSRVVGEFATEELVAKRAKTEAPAAGAAPKKN